MSLQEDIRKLIGSKGRFAMIYMDIDNFKYVNDTLGHQFGNLVLKGICNKLAGLMDENCDMYRLAGDKFIVICRDIGGILDIEQFALRILKSFKTLSLSRANPLPYCCGVSMYPEHGETMVD